MKKNKKHSDLKICSCDADGFSYQTNNTLTRIKWMEIESLTAYKADLLTSDEILIDVLHNNLILTISEVTPGWEEFYFKNEIHLSRYSPRLGYINRKTAIRNKSDYTLSKTTLNIWVAEIDRNGFMEK